MEFVRQYYPRVPDLLVGRRRAAAAAACLVSLTAGLPAGTAQTVPAGTSPIATSPIATSPIATSPIATSPIPTSPIAASAAESWALAGPASWRALIQESGHRRQPVVVLFSTPGCGFCELVRRDHLRHLVRAEGSDRLRVVELGLGDTRPFHPDPEISSGAEPTSSPASPAALAASLGIRFAPTVAFFGPQGEVAERLVGYQSADFYGAYLDQRIATARGVLGGNARPSAD